jgi:hypothetical protein
MTSTCRRTLGLVVLLLSASVALGQERSGFLGDYSGLEPAQDGSGDLIFVAPGAIEKLADYKSVMVDQPEIFIAADSPYKGMKPEDMLALSEELRSSVIGRLEGAYPVVDEPGPGVLYLRLAITDLYLKKKSRSPLGYTPAGAVVHGIKKAATKDMQKKINLVEMTLEVEVLDSEGHQRLVALVEPRGARKDKEKGQKKDPSSWEEMEAMIQSVGKRLRCRLDNARLPAEQQSDCRG